MAAAFNLEKDLNYHHLTVTGFNYVENNVFAIVRGNWAKLKIIATVKLTPHQVYERRVWWHIVRMARTSTRVILLQCAENFDYLCITVIRIAENND